MSILSRFKGQVIIDGIVGIVIVGVTVAFIWTSGLRLPGWDIRGKKVTLENEDKVQSQDVFIHKDGSLSLIDSVLTLEALLQDVRGVYLEGSGRLSMERSTIEGKNGQFVMSLTESGDKIPSVRISDSELLNSGGTYIYGRSSFRAASSSVGTLYVRERADVSLKDSSASLSFTVGEDEVFTGFVPGEGITRELESELGWNVSLENATIDLFQIELYEEDSVTVRDSQDIGLYLHTPGSLEEPFLFDGSVLSASLDGQMESEWNNLTWENTTFSRVSFFVAGTDELNIQRTRVGAIYAGGSSNVEVAGGTLFCSTCGVLESGVLTLVGIGVENVDNVTPTILVTGFGQLTVRDSDIKGVKIQVIGGGSLDLENCQFDDKKIEFEGEGTYTIDGVVQGEEG
jgi:hypothetical protein